MSPLITNAERRLFKTLQKVQKLKISYFILRQQNIPYNESTSLDAEELTIIDSEIRTPLEFLTFKRLKKVEIQNS